MKTVCNGMVAAPQFKGGDLKISDQNNWGGGGGDTWAKKKNLGGAKF